MKLGKTLAELESTMTAREFYYWVAFDRVNPIGDERADLHAAQIASAVYQSQGGKISLSECLLKFKEDKAPVSDEPMDIGQAMFNLLGKQSNGNG